MSSHLEPFVSITKIEEEVNGYTESDKRILKCLTMTYNNNINLNNMIEI